MLISGVLQNDSDLCFIGYDDFPKNKIVNAYYNPVRYGVLRCVYRKLYRTAIVKEVMFDEKFHVAEDLVFTFLVISKSSTFSIIDPDKYNHFQKYHYVKNPHSLTHEKISQKRIFDAFYAWFLYYKHLANLDFYQNKILKQELVNVLSQEFLEMYGSYEKKKDNYKFPEFKETLKFIKANKIIKAYKPISKIEKKKRLSYLFFRPFYRLIRKIFKK